MRNKLKGLLVGGLITLFGAGIALAVVVQGFLGGTGISSTTAGNIYGVLQVASTSPFLTYSVTTSPIFTGTVTVGGVGDISGGLVIGDGFIREGFQPLYLQSGGGAVFNSSSSIKWDGPNGNLTFPSNANAVFPDGSTVTITGTTTIRGIIDASSTHIAPVYTYSVCPQTGECDYNDLQSALTQASTTGAATKIFVKSGVYTAPSTGYLFCSNALTVQGEKQPQSGTTGTTLNFSGTTAPAGISSCNSSTQFTGLEFSNFKINNTGNASSSKGIDLSGMSLSSVHDLRITAANQSIFATGTISDYNNIYNIVSAPAGTSGNNTLVLGGRANFNLIQNIRSIDTASTTAYDIFARSNTCINCNSETGAALAFRIRNTSFGTTLIQPYTESDVIGIQFDSGSKATNIIGGYINDTTNIANLGGTFSFTNTYLNSKPFTYSLSNASTTQYPWLEPLMFSIPSANQAASTSRIIGLEVVNPTDGWTKGINWIMGTTTSTAAYSVGLYGPITTQDTFASSTLLVQTSSTVSGANISTVINTQWSSLTFMPAGTYYAVLESASTSLSYTRQANQVIGTGWCGLNDPWNTGTYADLPTSGPALTSTGSACPLLTVQMAVASSTY